MESAGVRFCREAGGRVVANAMLREFDLAAPNPRDQHRLEILVDGLPLFGGAQLAVDTTLVSPLHCDGSLHPRAANEDGAVLAAARLLKKRTYPELVAPRRRARLVVFGRRDRRPLAGGDTKVPVPLGQGEGQVLSPLKRRAEQAWRMRWGAILSCAAAPYFRCLLVGAETWRRCW